MRLVLHLGFSHLFGRVAPVAKYILIEWLYANWRVIVLNVHSLDPTLFLARYDILFWSLRAHQKLVLYGLFCQRVQGMYKV